jgi:4'-phosphopantetheinyl transferase
MEIDKTDKPISSKTNHILHPVILAVPDTVNDLKPKERVTFLSRHARRALAISAEKSRIPLGELVQDERNAPLPFNGTFWSITHKPEYVGGVVAPSPIGMDIEKIYARVNSLYHKTASEAEWALADRRIYDDHHLEIEYETQKWRIAHTYFEDHIASIVQNDFKVNWTILPNP